ncbi:MAG: GAF domain-containing protein, partial [Pseudomonadota bacterium]
MSRSIIFMGRESLGNRLNRINRNTLAVAMLIVSLTLTLTTYFYGMLSLVNSSQSTAKVLADNASAVLLFNDRITAGELLTSLNHTPDITTAAIYDDSGNKFADYSTDFTALPVTRPNDSNAVNRALNRIVLREPIINDGQQLGTLFLVVSPLSLYLQLSIQLVITWAAALLALFGARQLSKRLSNTALQPLQELTNLTQRVGLADFSVRAGASNITELDTLAQGFNRMLAEIHARDDSLNEHRNQLEQLVEGRTHELRKAVLEVSEASLVKSDLLTRIEHSRNILARSQEALTELIKSPLFAGNDLQLSLQHLTRQIAGTLAIGRVGIWRLEDGGTTLHCLCMWHDSTGSHEAGQRLDTRRFPAYFSALHRGETIVANNAHTHPDTSEFADVYLTPFNISALLDEPVRVGGKVWGVICCEQLGEAQPWRPEQIAFVTTTAALLAQSIEGI